MIDFSITPTEFTPAIECSGRIDMAKSVARFTCQDLRHDPATSESVDVTTEYIHRPTEAWLHFMAIGAERDHYPNVQWNRARAAAQAESGRNRVVR